MTWSRVWRVGGYVVVALAAAVTAALTLGVVRTAGDVGPGRVEVRADLQRTGLTSLELPPLGRVSAHTHDAPVAIRVRVDELDIEASQRVLEGDRPDEVLRTQAESDIDPLLRSYAIRAMLGATVVGAVVGAVLPRRRFAHVLVGAVSGGATAGLLLLSVTQGFDADAFEEASFEGPLERAPEVMMAVERNIANLEEVRDRAGTIGAQIAALYEVAASESAGPSGDELVVLHVSDIHLNPLGVEVTRTLADQFSVDAVLDTGDITSFGYPLETRIGELIDDIDAPYLLVPGNHDLPESRDALDGIANVTVLDDDVVTVGGVRILGIADPTFTADNVIGNDEARAIKEDEAPRVAALVETEQPDVLAVHDPVQAIEAHGSVPLVVAGHVHERRDQQVEGTRVLTVGSTGATGLGAFVIESDRAYEAQLLYFSEGDLVAIDYVEQEGISGNFRLDRRVVDPVDNDRDAAREPNLTLRQVVGRLPIMIGSARWT